MTQAEISYGDRIEGSQLNELINGFGIKKEDLDYSLPVRIVSTGHSKVMVPIRSKEILDNITINSPVLTKLSSQICCNGFYGFTFDSGEEGVLISGRMFAPAIGIAEDPVTGNANGPLGAYLTLYNRIEKRKEGFTFRIKQGEAINRKGYMDVHVYSSNEGAEMINNQRKCKSGIQNNNNDNLIFNMSEKGGKMKIKFAHVNIVSANWRGAC